MKKIIIKKVNIKDSIIDFIKNNKLFFIYVISCVFLGLLLRLLTTGGHIYFKASVSDLIVILITASFAYLLKPKSRYRYYIIWIVFLSLLCVANTIYYDFYQSYLSVNLLATASMIGQVNDSLVAKLHFIHFIYLIVPILFIIYINYLKKKEYYDVVDNIKCKKIFKNIYKVVVVLLICVVCTVSKSDGSRFIKLWNRESVVKKYGIYVYTVNDLVQSVRPRINTLFGYDEAALKFREYYACKWKNKNDTNEYTDIFKGKNVIFIHAESIQNFLIDLKINNKEVTPNLNKIAKEGIYFNKFYPQISVGTSSDTEFTLLTGLMPSSSGTVFVNYYDRTYKGMPDYFNKLGYYTFSMHANNADYWNRKTMHMNLGYTDFYSKELFDIPETTDDPDYIGLGLSDKSFFKQINPLLDDIQKYNSPFFGTIITLSNHSPFNDLEKYGEFDVTMNYEYTDDNGKKVKSNAPYLDGTTMGNYLKSAHYADEALGELYDMFKNTDIGKNTIIILYGDHEARIGKKDFDILYNYDPLTNDTISKEDDNYYDVYGYNYDLLKNTPFIIWSSDTKFNKTIDSTMGMYDVLPTIANMFGFEEKYSLGNDIFSNNEKIVVFPNGNVLTDIVYYSESNDEYITFTNDPIDSDYIDKLKNYAAEVLEVSNGIVVHDLIKRESAKIGECTK